MTWLPPGSTVPDSVVEGMVSDLGLPRIAAPSIRVPARTLPDHSEDEVKAALFAAFDNGRSLNVDARPAVMVALGATTCAQFNLVELHISSMLDAWAGCYKRHGIELSPAGLRERVVEIVVTELLAMRRSLVVVGSR